MAWRLKYRRVTLFAFITVFLSLVITYVYSQVTTEDKIDTWVGDKNLALKADSILKKMTLEDKVGQLFMYQSYPNGRVGEMEIAMNVIRKCKIGGIIFFQGLPSIMAKDLSNYKRITKYPLFVSMDSEWGPSMRLDSIMPLQRMTAMGAVTDNRLFFEYGRVLGEICKSLEINITFAPVVDIPIKGDNKALSSRVIGDDPLSVYEKAYQFTRGVQSQKVLACAKHFPGHGDTKIDSHYEIPLIDKKFKALYERDLVPFIKLIEGGIGGVMVGHLNVPAIDDRENSPASVSDKIIREELIENLKFKGLVFTDGLEMRALTSIFSPEEACFRALKAGADQLVIPQKIEQSYKYVLQKVKNNELSIVDLDYKVRKILMAKLWMGLFSKKSREKVIPVNLDSLNMKINRMNYIFARESITMLKNRNGSIPYCNIKNNSRIAYIEVGDGRKCFETFKTKLENKDIEVTIDKFILNNENIESFEPNDILKKYRNVIVAYHPKTVSAYKQYGGEEALHPKLKELLSAVNSTFLLLGSPYFIDKYPFCREAKTLIVGYNNIPETAKAMAEAIVGDFPIVGRLPVCLDRFKTGWNYLQDTTYKGYNNSKKEKVKLFDSTELKKQIEMLEIDPVILDSLDKVVLKAIENGEFPGGQILIAKDDIMFYNKQFGTLSYKDPTKVTDSTIYDIASVSKVIGLLSVVMKLYDKGIIDVDAPITEYLPNLPKDKDKILVKDLLMHNSGLPAWYPFHKELVRSKTDLTDNNREALFSTIPTVYYYYRVADNLYANLPSVKKAIVDIIYDIPLKRKKEYLYSDLGMILMQEIVEKTTNRTLNVLLDSFFVKPMGLCRITYNPLEKGYTNIAPTEEDHSFRGREIKGEVHDELAFLFGGVAGNAGLFSNTYDIWPFLKMYLNKGVYKNVRYLKESTVERFTLAEYTKKGNRRGLGFDKADQDTLITPSYAAYSLDGYGHSGFSGTFFWVEPKYNITYIFLSNRICPVVTNNLLIKNRTRQNLLTILIRYLENK